MKITDILLPLLALTRPFFLVASIIAPIALLVSLFKALGQKKLKKAGLYFSGLLMSIGLLYCVYADVSVPARVNLKSIEDHYDELLLLEDGATFKTGYITGNLIVHSNDELLFYREQKSNGEKHVINDEAVCYISPVYCLKDDRISHLFEPTQSLGDILIETPEKTFYIEYYYDGDSIFSLLWPITNPEIIYRHRIDLGDILEHSIPYSN